MRFSIRQMFAWTFLVAFLLAACIGCQQQPSDNAVTIQFDTRKTREPIEDGKIFWLVGGGSMKDYSRGSACLSISDARPLDEMPDFISVAIRDDRIVGYSSVTLLEDGPPDLGALVPCNPWVGTNLYLAPDWAEAAKLQDARAKKIEQAVIHGR